MDKMTDTLSNIKARREATRIFYNDDFRAFKACLKDPIVITLVLGICPLIVGTSSAHSATESVLIGILLFIASTFLGSRVTAVWTKVQEQGELIFRGKLSVRGIGLFLKNIERLEGRLSQLLSRHVQSPVSESVFRGYLEEVILTCRSIREEGFSSIENWSDILPEVDGRSRLADISAIKTRLSRASEYAAEVKKELSVCKTAGEERDQLLKRMSQKLQSQETLETLLVDASLAYDRSLLSGLRLPEGYASVLSTLSQNENVSLASSIQVFNTGNEQ
jgi:hypothetical protein